MLKCIVSWVARLFLYELSAVNLNYFKWWLTMGSLNNAHNVYKMTALRTSSYFILSGLDYTHINSSWGSSRYMAHGKMPLQSNNTSWYICHRPYALSVAWNKPSLRILSVLHESYQLSLISVSKLIFLNSGQWSSQRRDCADVQADLDICSYIVWIWYVYQEG